MDRELEACGTGVFLHPPSDMPQIELGSTKTWKQQRMDAYPYLPIPVSRSHIDLSEVKVHT